MLQSSYVDRCRLRSYSVCNPDPNHQEAVTFWNLLTVVRSARTGCEASIQLAEKNIFDCLRTVRKGRSFMNLEAFSAA